MTSSRGIGLRTQILLIFLGAAIVPLAVVGLWLTQSAMRAGEDLLLDHLTQSAARFANATESRWSYRQADIALVAGNEATVRAVTNQTVSSTDSVYLDRIARDIERTIPIVELRDAAGRTHWSSTPQSRAGSRDERVGTSSARADAGPVFRIETPILDGTGRTVGTAVTDVAMSALIPPDSTRPLVPGAELGVRNSATNVLLVPLDAHLPFTTADHVRLRDEDWLAVHRTLANPPIDFVIAAPLTSYVAPFGRAATIGVAALMIVAGLAVLFTTALATRATRPLEQLASASDAVTEGKLDQRVDVGGPAEVRRVGAAFNLMTESLNATLDALTRRSAMAAVGEFATSLSHDVRNALTSIRVDLDRLSMRDLHDPVATTLVTRALNSVSRLDASVAGALRVARRGKTPMKDVDLRVPIRAAADVVRGTIAALSAELELHLPPDPLGIRGDEAALQQLFANLLFNASQAMSGGGHASIDAERIDDDVQVTISDDGVGISAANLAKLEQPFFSTKTDGTGLGLPIARQIVAAHGGSLSIESRDSGEKGTTVRLRLPLGTKRSRDVNAPFPQTTAIG